MFILQFASGLKSSKSEHQSENLEDLLSTYGLCFPNYPFLLDRGKGENHRLGHSVEDHVRFPKQVEALNGKKIVDIAVGKELCLTSNFAAENN